ncbi:MAG: glycosyltransferase family 2 protein [Candidatus Eisenbacteria bacterium]|nr:glycosyltransferase family 2 protein [Candidatus Eisenbacteria bacterium]
MEADRLAAVVVARNEAVRLPATLAALGRALEGVPGAARLVVDAGSTDGTAQCARAHGWPVLRLDPAGATCPGAAREAARRHAGAARLLYVDADVRVEPGFVREAAALLDRDPGLAGVGGALRFDEGAGAPPAWCGPPRAARMLAALAMYRASALESAGGFVPWLESEEDADIGLRITRAGSRLAVISPGGVHVSGPRGGLRETFRRYRAGLYFGQGRVLRLRWGGALFAATVARQAPYLGVLGLWLGAGVAAWFTRAAGPCLAVALCVAWLAVAVRKRSLVSGSVSLVTWHVMAWGLLAGLAGTPRAREFRVEAVPDPGPAGGGA